MLNVSLLLFGLGTGAPPQTTPPRMTKERVTLERDAVIQGGGSLLVNGETCAFAPKELRVGEHPQLGKAIKLTGTLTPSKGASWTFELQVTEKGQILMLQWFRKEGETETGRWSPTLKSKVEVVTFKPEAGGRVELRFSGPLSGVVSGVAKTSSWSGTLWVTPK
jgi:hypothetical protein